MEKPKVKINKPANNIMWVECWVQRVNGSSDFSIFAEQCDDKWISEFTIPKIDKTILCKADTEVGAMLKAATDAKKAIKDYVKDHPAFDNLVEPYWCHNWEIEEDEEGHFLSLHRNSKARKKEGIEMSNEINSTIRAIQNSTDKIAKIYGSLKGFFIHIYDKNVFEEDVDLVEVQDRVWEEHVQKFKLDSESIRWSSVRIMDDSILVIYSIDPETLEKMPKQENIN